MFNIFFPSHPPILVSSSSSKTLKIYISFREERFDQFHVTNPVRIQVGNRDNECWLGSLRVPGRE